LAPSRWRPIAGAAAVRSLAGALAGAAAAIEPAAALPAELWTEPAMARAAIAPVEAAALQAVSYCVPSLQVRVEVLAWARSQCRDRSC